MEVLRPRLDVIAVPPPPPGMLPPATPGSGVDGGPLDAVVDGRRVPGVAVVRALEALGAATGHGSRVRRGRRLVLDPADDDRWRIATLVGPWSEGMTGFDASGTRLLESVRSEQRLVLWLTPPELSEIRWRARADGNRRDVLIGPGHEPADRSPWMSHPVLVVFFLLVAAPDLWGEHMDDLRDAHSTPLSTAVDLLLLAGVTGLVLGGLWILLVAVRRRWRLRRPRR